MACPQKPVAGVGARPASPHIHAACRQRGCIAQRLAVRALRTAVPARFPLLPARMRSLRSVSVILTSPPQQAKRARSGSLQLHSAQTCRREDQSEIALGNPEPPPAPEIHGPGSRFPRPLLPPPEMTVPAIRMTGEGASKTGAHDRGKCAGRRAPRGRAYSAAPASQETTPGRAERGASPGYGDAPL